MRYTIHALDVQNLLQNYIWMLVDHERSEAVAVDPTEAGLVEQFCRLQQLHLRQIWLTHWHKDHIGGVPELLTLFPDIQIYGPRDELSKISLINYPLQHHDHFEFNDLNVEIISTPGHTLGHITYYIDEIETLFSGDTLFAMGCGRLFEGTAEQMYHSLNRLAALPPKTKVYCTHEYTLSNAQFALTVEPDNIMLQQRFEEVAQLRKQNKITLPSTIEGELETNPFLRVSNVEDFAQLRRLKDQF